MNDKHKINHTIDPVVAINKYSHDITEYYELDEKTQWVQELLEELHEQLDPEDTYPAGSIKISLEISRKKNNYLGDFLLVKAHIDAKYHLPCGLTLVPLFQHMDHHVAGAFLHDSMAKLPEYEESTTVFADNAEVELYFYSKGVAEVKEFIHEQVFLEVPPFPRSTTIAEEL